MVEHRCADDAAADDTDAAVGFMHMPPREFTRQCNKLCPSNLVRERHYVSHLSAPRFRFGQAACRDCATSSG